MTTLEQRYRTLLRAYPAWYRAERGDEILGTLLEASAPGRSWPAARDAKALILGGLRVRAWQHQRQTTAAALRQAVLLAAVLDLARWSAGNMALYILHWGSAWLSFLFGLLPLAVMVGAWFGRRAVVAVVAAVVAVVAAVVAGLWLYQPLNYLDALLQPVVPLAVLAILVLRERLPRSWLWPTGVWYLIHLVSSLVPAPGPVVWVTPLAFLGFAVAAVIWSVIDARPLLAAALVIAIQYGYTIGLTYSSPGWPPPAVPWYLWPWSIPAFLGVALAAVAVWRVRRQAVL